MHQGSGRDYTVDSDEPLNDIIVGAAESAIREVGLAKIGAGLATLFAVASSLGLFVGKDVTASIAVAGIILLLLLGTLASLVDRRAVYRELAVQRDVLTRYAKDIKARQTAQAFHINEWDEKVTMKADGTASIQRRLKLVVGAGPLKAFWTVSDIDPAPPNHNYRKKVRVEACLFDDDGGRVGVPRTSEWIDHALSIYIHMLQPQPSYSEVEVLVELYWPRYFGSLKDGQTVPTEWSFLRPVEKFSISVGDSSRVDC